MEVTVQSLLSELSNPETPESPQWTSEPMAALRDRLRSVTLAESLEVVRALRGPFRVASTTYSDPHSELIRLAVQANPTAEVGEALLVVADDLPEYARGEALRSLIEIAAEQATGEMMGRTLGLAVGWAPDLGRPPFPMSVFGLLEVRTVFPEVVLPAVAALADHPSLLDDAEAIRTAYAVAGTAAPELLFPTRYSVERLRPIGVHQPDRLIGITIRQCLARLGSGDHELLGLAELPAVLTTPYIASVFEGQVLNGGLDQFFFNSPDGLTRRVPAVLTELGLDEMAATASDAIGMYEAHAHEIKGTRGSIEGFSELAQQRLFAGPEKELAGLYARRSVDEALAEYLPQRIAALAAALADEPVDAEAFAAIPRPSTPLRPPPAPPSEIEVLPIHGSPDMPIVWRPVCEKVDAPHTLPMIECQQYASPIWGYTIPAEAAGLDVSDATIVAGFGWGGAMAIAAALAHPAPALLLVEPLLVSSLSGAVGAKTEYLLEEHVAAVRSETPDAIRTYIDMFHGPGKWDAMGDAERSFYREKAAWNAADVDAILRFHPKLSTIGDRGIPVRVVVGGDSPEVMQEIAASIASEISTAELVVVEGAGHDLRETHAAVVAGHLQELVNAVRATRS